MTSLVVAGAGMALVAAALATVLLALRRPLAATLIELCGEPNRGRLWNRVARVALVAGTLLVVLLGSWLSTSLEAGTPPLLGVMALLRWGLTGLLLSLGVVSAAVVQYTLRLGRHTPPEYGAGSVPPRQVGG